MIWLRGEKEEGDLRKGVFSLGLVINAISQRFGWVVELQKELDRVKRVWYDVLSDGTILYQTK